MFDENRGCLWKAETSSSEEFIKENARQRMQGSYSDEKNEEMKDVDNTYEDSWPAVVGGLVMIPKSEKAIHHCMTVHIQEPRRDVWAHVVWRL
jgi:hypothetical protein